LPAGIYHYSGAPFCSWFDLARAVFELAQARGLKVPASVIPIATHEYPVPAPRPANSALDSSPLCAALGIPPSDWMAGIRLLVNAWQPG
jgi:dTDP-4-dehydrorhamnose reductase